MHLHLIVHEAKPHPTRGEYHLCHEFAYPLTPQGLDALYTQADQWVDVRTVWHMYAQLVSGEGWEAWDARCHYCRRTSRRRAPTADLYTLPWIFDPTDWPTARERLLWLADHPERWDDLVAGRFPLTAQG